VSIKININSLCHLGGAEEVDEHLGDKDFLTIIGAATPTSLPAMTVFHQAIISLIIKTTIIQASGYSTQRIIPMSANS